MITAITKRSRTMFVALPLTFLLLGTGTAVAQDRGYESVALTTPSPPSDPGSTGSGTLGDTLPFTGMDIAAVLIAGVVLALAGILIAWGLRRVERPDAS